MEVVAIFRTDTEVIDKQVVVNKKILIGYAVYNGGIMISELFQSFAEATKWMQKKIKIDQEESPGLSLG